MPPSGNTRKSRSKPFDLLAKFGPIDIGHNQIDEHQAEGLLLDHFEGLLRVVGGPRVEPDPSENLSHHFQLIGLVVYYKDGSFFDHIKPL